MTNTIRPGDWVRVEAFEFRVTDAGGSNFGPYLLGTIAPGGGTVKVRASQATKVQPPKVGDRLDAVAVLPADAIIVHDDGLAAQVRDDGTVDILNGQQRCSWSHFVAAWRNVATIAYLPVAL